jgi:hypothetical protein
MAISSKLTSRQLHVSLAENHRCDPVVRLRITSGLSFLGLRPAKPYENDSEVVWQQVGAARSNGQWISRGRRFV